MHSFTFPVPLTKDRFSRQESLISLTSSIFLPPGITWTGNSFAPSSFETPAMMTRLEDVSPQGVVTPSATAVESSHQQQLLLPVLDLEPTPIREGLFHHRPTPMSVSSLRLDKLQSTLDDVLRMDDIFGGAEQQDPLLGTTVQVPSSQQQQLPPNKRSMEEPSFHVRNKKARTCHHDGEAVEDISAAAGGAEEEEETRFRPYQADLWTDKFQELMDFKKEHGHCCVPHTYTPNQPLARWVKRQRYQYKLKMEGKPNSTMTQERIVALEDMGFVWDSHGAAWLERWNELVAFEREHGHANVPSNFAPSPPLATWVKCQRRQYKLFRSGSLSNMTLDRIQRLQSVGFEWELRSGKAQLSSPSRKKKTMDILP